MQTERAAVPAIAAWLGGLGALPFVVLAVAMVGLDGLTRAFVVQALVGYGAVILSFLGGIHWGLVMATRHSEPRHLVWAVVPSLLGWVSVVMPPHAGLVIQGLVLVVCYLVDRRAYPVFGLSRWLTLRFRLTLVASMSCFLAAARA